jgi:hypothetical protein
VHVDAGHDAARSRPCAFLDPDRRHQVIAARAAELLGSADPEEAGFADLAEDLVRKILRLLPGVGVGRQLRFDEAPALRPEEIVVLVEHIDGDRHIAPPGWEGG